jgi:hypothetical protein
MSDPTLPDNGAVHRVENASIDRYDTYLQDKHRPPSRGGNGRAWHSHVIRIGENTYSFLGLGFRKWVYLSDSVSFAWSWDRTQRYRNIDPDSIAARDRHGNPVTRGHRGTKPWRTATTRAPVSRREWRD